MPEGSPSLPSGLLGLGSVTNRVPPLTLCQHEAHLHVVLAAPSGPEELIRSPTDTSGTKRNSGRPPGRSTVPGLPPRCAGGKVHISNTTTFPIADHASWAIYDAVAGKGAGTSDNNQKGGDPGRHTRREDSPRP